MNFGAGRERYALQNDPGLSSPFEYLEQLDFPDFQDGIVLKKRCSDENDRGVLLARSDTAV